MSSPYQREITEYVAKYLKDRFGNDVTPEEIFNTLPWHKIVWQQFHAHAYFGEKEFYFSWDDVPEPYEGMYANIISEEKLERYQYRDCKWDSLGSATEDLWK